MEAAPMTHQAMLEPLLRVPDLAALAVEKHLLDTVQNCLSPLSKQLPEQLAVSNAAKGRNESDTGGHRKGT